MIPSRSRLDCTVCRHVPELRFAVEPRWEDEARFDDEPARGVGERPRPEDEPSGGSSSSSSRSPRPRRLFTLFLTFLPMSLSPIVDVVGRLGVVVDVGRRLGVVMAVERSLIL